MAIPFFLPEPKQESGRFVSLLMKIRLHLTVINFLLSKEVKKIIVFLSEVFYFAGNKTFFYY